MAGFSGASIRGPASHNNLVGIAPTQELVSTAGTLEAGINVRAGPICRSVADAAAVLDIIAGYDPSDSMTALSVGRFTKPLVGVAMAAGSDLRPCAGLRVAVVREQMSTADSKESRESCALFDTALLQLEALGCVVQAEEEEGMSLFTAAISRHLPHLFNARLAPKHPGHFAADGDHIATLLDTKLGLGDNMGLRELQLLAGGRAEGEQRYHTERYLYPD